MPRGKKVKNHVRRKIAAAAATTAAAATASPIPAASKASASASTNSYVSAVEVRELVSAEINDMKKTIEAKATKGMQYQQEVDRVGGGNR